MKQIMKKILFLAVMTVVAFFASCSNKEIEVGYALNVKVDPSEVVAPFVPMNAGDLDACPKGYMLRVHVFAYNAEGVLKGSAVSYINNYGSKASVDLHLPIGKYTLITVTDVIKGTAQNITLEYWKISGEENISSLKVSETDYISHQRGILGIANGQYNVTTQNATYTMTPKAAGALIVSLIRNIHQYSSVTYYELDVNRNSDYLSFNSDGDYLVAVKNNNNSFDWRLSTLEPADYPDYNGIYDYIFLLPVSNISFHYSYKQRVSGSDKWYKTSDRIYTLKAGEEHMFVLDMYDSENSNKITFTTYNNVNTTSSSRQAGGFVEQYNAGNVLLNKQDADIDTHSASSANIVDLIETLEQ